MERISLYECSQVPSGHPTGLRWRAASSPAGGGSGAGSAPAIRASTAVETVLRPYEAHHLPRPA